MSNTESLMSYSRQIREWSVSIKRTNEILNYSGGNEFSFGCNNADDIRGIVEFSDVSFSYKGKNELDKDISSLLYGNELVLSPSSLEMFSKCKYSYINELFVGYRRNWEYSFEVLNNLDKKLE